MPGCIADLILQDGIRRAWQLRFSDMNGIIVIAVFLMIAWLVLRVAFALTGLAFHLLWIAAIVLFVIWVIGKVSGK